MGIHKIYFSVIYLLLASFSMFSQEKNKENEKLFLPISIYTALETSTNSNRLFSINNRLNFKAYTFVYLDEKKLKEGYFTIPIENIGSTPSSLIYDTYMDIYNELNLEKSFFKVADLYKPYIPTK